MEPSQQNQDGANNASPGTRSLAAMHQAGANEARLPMVEPGFNSLQSFELMQRQAKLLACSTLVPESYRMDIIKYNKDGTIKNSTPNPAGLSNCVLALNMSHRMRADPIMVMQNLVLVEGRPSWSSQWVIAQINNCGRFEPLRFDLKELGDKTVPYESYEWGDDGRGGRERKKNTRDVKIVDMECTAWTVPRGVVVPHGIQTIADAKKAGLPILKGPRVSIEIAVKEGWYTKNGSKWQTMPELMLHYRSGAFFGRLYAPELLMGIPPQDEAEDAIVPTTLTPAGDGAFEPAASTEKTNVSDLRRRASDKDVATDATVKPTATDKPADGKAEPKQDPNAATPQGEAQPPQESTAAPASDDKTKPVDDAPGSSGDELFGRTD